MKKISRTLSVLLVVFMLLTSAPLSGFVGLEFELPEWPAFEAKASSSEYLTRGYCGEITETTDGTQLSWVLDEEGVLTITGEGRMAPEAFNYDLRIKEVVIGDGITNISDYCFSQCTNLVKVTMGSGVEVIGTKAFQYCSNFTDVEFSDSLKTIGNYAFYYCTAFTDIVLPDSLTTIGVYAFCACSALEEIVFPDSLITVKAQAFHSCYKLKEVIFPDSLTTIEKSVFGYCKKLETVTIGSGTTSIDSSAFLNCNSFYSITVSKENSTYSSYDGILYNKAKTELIFVPEAISDEVEIPASVEEFTYRAVDGCKKITALNVEEGNVNYKSIDGVVYSADGKSVIVCPRGKTGVVSIADGVETVEDYAFYTCSELTGMFFPDSLTEIGENAFRSCSGLAGITFPASLTTIGYGAFQSCSGLENIVFPASLTTVGSYAFAYCNMLTDVSIPDSLTIIRGCMFSNCKKLETVTIGSGTNVFNLDAFSECNSLYSITVSEDNSSFSSYDGILYNKAKTKLIFVPEAISGEVSIPDSVEEFTYSAVDGCQKITELNVEEGNQNYKSIDGIVYSADGKTVVVCPRGKTGAVTIANGTETIGRYAFYSCYGLTDVTFPDSLITIGWCAFQYCTKLTEIDLPDSFTTIENYAFQYCYKLADVLLPDTLTSIGRYAFYCCYGLTTINIPKQITKINNYMFDRCGFTELTLPETVQSFDNQNWDKLTTLTIENKYCEYTTTTAPVFAKDCIIRAYCGSLGHTFATKRLLNFESLGHTYLDWYVYQVATYEADGIERRDCAYCDGYEERVIPKLVDDVFTASFVAGGEVVATVDFPKGTTQIEEPKVPVKDRYIGEWEDYTLTNADITINAVYTLIKSDDASYIETESETIHYTDKDDILFKFKAWADAAVVKSTVSKSVPLDIVLVVDQSGSMDETLGGSVKKVDALKDTAKDFVNTVFENAKMTDADHRISLVGFGLSGNYQGFEKNENTELLTSANGIVKFDDIKTTDYASSLLSVNIDGKVNDALLTAVDSIGARGATAADLGFEMAKGVFANTDSTDRQRVVIFMTDGEPTYLSGFQTSVANSAIANALVLKDNYNASIYSVGVFSDSDSKNTNIKKFMNAVSSSYPVAKSMSYMGQGIDGQYYLTVNNTDSLASVFKSISTESLSHTAPFDNLTFIKTLSENVTLTSQQEQQMRIGLIRQYGIANDDIVITVNDDGTTTVQINGLTPVKIEDEEGNVTYEVAVEFFASLNEKAVDQGDYAVDTEDSGVMLGEDAKGYEATFDTSTVTLSAEKARVIFTINGEVYEVSENLSSGYAVAPDLEIAEDWQFSGWDTSSTAATNGMVIDATLVKAQRTATWHTAEGDIVQTYVEGEFITAPIVEYNADGDTFLSWDKSIPTTMPDENLEFTAVYGGHIHQYTSKVTTEMTCLYDGVRMYTCLCGDTYDEAITAIGHNYEAITPSLEKNDAKCTFVCTNCGDKYDYALDYAVVDASGKRYKVLYEFQLTDDDLNTDMQPDGEIQIRIPLSELHGNARKVTVIRTNDDGSKTEVPAVIENGFLVVTCDHFTPYEVIFDIPCEEHVQGEWIVTKEANCTEEGSHYAECTKCENVIAEETINKLPHTESQWITVKAATCTAEGTKHIECTECHTTIKTEAIQKIAHNYGKTVVAPTCTEGGYTIYSCGECTYSYIADETPVINHNYSDGVCTNCGDSKASDCSCNCHKTGFMGFIWKILRFFYKLFKMNPVCDCGIAHY